MTLETADGKVVLTSTLMTLTKPDGTALQWDKGSVSDEKEATLVKRVVLASIESDTNVLSNEIVLCWIRSRQLKLAMFAEYKRLYPERAVEFAPAIASARWDLDCVSQSLIEATKVPSRTSDVVRAERFTELKETARPFFNAWWAVQKKKASFLPETKDGLQPGQVGVLDSKGKLIPLLNSFSSQADWNELFTKRCTMKRRKDIALHQGVFALLEEETNLEGQTLSSQVSRGLKEIKKGSVENILDTLRKFV